MGRVEVPSLEVLLFSQLALGVRRPSGCSSPRCRRVNGKRAGRVPEARHSPCITVGSQRGDERRERDMKQPVSLREGMVVHSADGSKIGKVTSCRSDGFITEKGVFLPKATQFQYDDVSDVRGDDIYLAHEQAELSDASWWSKREQALLERKNRATASEETSSARAAKTPDEIRMPLAEEE